MALINREKIEVDSENKLPDEYESDECQTKIDYKTRKSKKSEIINKHETSYMSIEANRNDADTESVYEDSFCSDISDEDSELTNVTRRSSISEMPLFRFNNSKSLKKKQNLISLNRHKSVSISKICDDDFLTLEDKLKYLSLNEVRQTRSAQACSTRKNMSFTNDETMKIERDNQILLRKIMAQHKPQKTKTQPIQSKLSSSAINRKRLQKKIEEDNMMLLRRLQQAKSCALDRNKIRGYRATYL